EPYTIFGYKGKQVRDNIHSADVIAALEAYRRNSRPGEVYNLGGTRRNSVSILEAIAKLEELVGRRITWSLAEDARVGDHMCYISDMRKFRAHYPEWELTRGINDILREMVAAERERIGRKPSASY